MKKSIFLFLITFGVSNCIYAQDINHRLHMETEDTQCFNNNMFCFRDSVFPKTGRTAAKLTYLFSDGSKVGFTPPANNVLVICKTFQDPSGGTYSLVAELEDSSGQIIKKYYNNIMTVLTCNSSLSSNAGFGNINLSKLSGENAWLIVGSNLTELSFKLYDLNGRAIAFNQTLNADGSIKLSCRGTYSGLYVLQMLNADGQFLRTELLRF